MGPHNSGDGSDDQFKAGKKIEMLTPFLDVRLQKTRVLKTVRSMPIEMPCSSINAVTADSESIAPDMEAVLQLQTTDEDIGIMRSYGDLPDDDKQTQRVVVESS